MDESSAEPLFTLLVCLFVCLFEFTLFSAHTCCYITAAESVHQSGVARGFGSVVKHLTADSEIASSIPLTPTKNY